MICIIPARGGSKRVHRKNLQVVGGMTLVERAMDTALRSGCFKDGILVSSEDPEILELAGKYGLPRPMHLSGDDVPTYAVVNHILGPCSAAVLQCTTPEMKLTDIAIVMDMFKLNPYRNACTVNDDGRRSGFYVSAQWEADMWRGHYNVWSTWDYVDINEPSDLEEVRRRFAT
jgi:CMP-N-acetylneuraminic acid synthetase